MKNHRMAASAATPATAGHVLFFGAFSGTARAEGASSRDSPGSILGDAMDALDSVGVAVRAPASTFGACTASIESALTSIVGGPNSVGGGDAAWSATRSTSDFVRPPCTGPTGAASLLSDGVPGSEGSGSGFFSGGRGGGAGFFNPRVPGDNAFARCMARAGAGLGGRMDSGSMLMASASSSCPTVPQMSGLDARAPLGVTDAAGTGDALGSTADIGFDFGSGVASDFARSGVIFGKPSLVVPFAAGIARPPLGGVGARVPGGLSAAPRPARFRPPAPG